MAHDLIKKHPAYQYAKDVVEGKHEIANQHMKIVCKRFLKEIDKDVVRYNFNGKQVEYVFDEKELQRISVVLKFLNMASGTKRGDDVESSLIGFQWFFLVNIFCWKHAKDLSRRRYQHATMLIGRKNSKTFLSAIIFILLLFLEPKFSELYSVAPDKELSKQIKRQMDAIIQSSPEMTNKFKISQKEIVCIPTKNKFTPLANSNDRLDGREPTAFLVDETGALKNHYPIDAMESGQTTIPNSLGIIISTAYTTLENPMTQEVQRSEDKVDGEHYDPTYFSMLFKTDEPKNWNTDVNEMLKANPLSQHVPEIKEDLLEKRQQAILYKATRQNFLTKFMNIFVDGDEGEAFVEESTLMKGELHEEFDWYGRDVMVGIDFAQSRDNFGIAMITYDEDRQVYVSKSWAVIAKDREQEKTKNEKEDYPEYIKNGWVISSGGPTIDYGEVEEFILTLEDHYGVNILQIGYDRWQAQSSVAKFEGAGYDCVEVPQNARGLYPPTKFLREQIENEEFYFDKNDFYVHNFLNATMIVDNQLSYYLNKKKSKGKIDMVAATVDAMALWLIQRVEEVEGSYNPVHSL